MYPEGGSSIEIRLFDTNHPDSGLFGGYAADPFVYDD
jgi:hypothetical protein